MSNKKDQEPGNIPGTSGEQPQAAPVERIQERAKKAADALNELLAELSAQGYTRIYSPVHLFIGNVLVSKIDKETAEIKITPGDCSTLYFFGYDTEDDDEPDTTGAVANKSHRQAKGRPKNK